MKFRANTSLVLSLGALQLFAAPSSSTTAAKAPARASASSKYSWEYKGDDDLSGCGHQVLGQSWVGHYGKNHRQSTRIDIDPAQHAHPILCGVKDVHVQAGGYVGKPTDGTADTKAKAARPAANSPRSMAPPKISSMKAIAACS